MHYERDPIRALGCLKLPTTLGHWRQAHGLTQAQAQRSFDVESSHQSKFLHSIARLIGFCGAYASKTAKVYSICGGGEAAKRLELKQSAWTLWSTDALWLGDTFLHYSSHQSNLQTTPHGITQPITQSQHLSNMTLFIIVTDLL